MGVCRKTVEREAISYVEDEKGNGSIVFDFDKCIVCGSCAYICADDAIIIEDIGDSRLMITPSGRKEFKLKNVQSAVLIGRPNSRLSLCLSRPIYR